MIFQFSFMGAMVVGAWIVSLSFDSILPVLLAGLIFFSKSIPVDLLFLLSLTLIGFIQAMLGGKRTGSAGAQKKYFLTLVGIFSALFGASIEGMQCSLLFIFFGLLLSIPNGVTSFFFNRHYERITLKAYLQSVLVPAFVALNILLKVKSEMKVDFAQVWDISLVSLGLFTFLYSSILSFVKNSFKSTLIYLSQAWIGLALFLLAIDGGSLNYSSLTAISIGSISALVLLSLAAQLGHRYLVFAKIATLGLPGMIWFSVLLFSIKMTLNLNVLWIVVFGLGYLLQAISLVTCRASPVAQPDKKVKIKFWFTVGVQFVSGLGLYWLEFGVTK